MKQQRIRKAARSFAASPLLACLALAACDEGPASPGPADEGAFDAETARTSFEAMESVLQSPEWATYTAMSSRIGSSGVVAAVVPALEAADGLPSAGRAAGRLLAAVSRIPLISPGNLGKTFAIDPETGEYAVDPGRTGAPSDGVRFILYGLVDGTDDPDLGNEIGHVDLVDAGAGIPGIDLRLTAVVDGLTFLDYGVALEGSETEASASIDGFVTDGVDRLAFTYDVDGTDIGGQQTVHLDAILSVNSGDLAVSLTADGSSFEGQDGSLSAAVSVQYGSESLDVEVTGDERSIEASFRVNGSLFATAMGDPEAPIIRGADGNELSEEEMIVLARIIDTTDDVFRFFEELVEPAEGIIQLAAIL